MAEAAEEQADVEAPAAATIRITETLSCVMAALMRSKVWEHGANLHSCTTGEKHASRFMSLDGQTVLNLELVNIMKLACKQMEKFGAE